MTSFTDGTVTSTASYYRGGWLKTFTNGSNKTVTYQYNGVGLVSRLTEPGGLNFDYTYNVLNQLSTVVNPNPLTINFSYDNGGRLTRITRPGSNIDYEYNARDWITAVRNRTTGGTVRYDATYSYNDGTLWDHTGNPLKRVETISGADYTTTLRYDNVYRLTEETLRNSGGAVQYTWNYAYDQVGNRLMRNSGGPPPYLGYGYDANDKLTTTRPVGGGPPGPINGRFYYDGAGNMTSVDSDLLGDWSMTYDDESRLTSVTYPTGTESFIYNALGQRMKLTVGGTVTRYVYDGDRVLEETNDGGTVQARYTTAAGSYYAPLLHIWRATGESRFPMYDLTGSVRGLVDAGGAVTDTYSLELFGKQRSSTGSTPSPYRFGGAWGYINGVSGLQQLGARFYWPEIGRFVQQDPAGDGMNWYAYVENSPVGWVDPEGLHLTESWLHNLSHWDCIWGPGLKEGAAIVADTAIPFANPFANRGAYNPNDPFAQASGTMATIGVAAGEAAVGGLVAEAAGARVATGAGSGELRVGGRWIGKVAAHGANHRFRIPFTNLTFKARHLQIMLRIGGKTRHLRIPFWK